LRLANSTWGMAKKLEKNIGKCHGDIRLISPNEMDFCIFQVLDNNINYILRPHLTA
jgi:hypothetical protein